MAKRILVAAEHGAEVLLLMVLVGKTSQRGLSPALVYGLFGLCVCVVPPFVSLDVMYVTGALAALSESPYTAPLAAVGAFCISAAAMVLLISYSRNAAARAQVQGEDWQMELCRAAASGCEMTPRELDVMVYAYRGYSARKIAETLLVSESTVKAHLSHCYRKLGIHSKQELISLIDSYKER